MQLAEVLLKLACRKFKGLHVASKVTPLKIIFLIRARRNVIHEQILARNNEKRALHMKIRQAIMDSQPESIWILQDLGSAHVAERCVLPVVGVTHEIPHGTKMDRNYGLTAFRTLIQLAL